MSKKREHDLLFALLMVLIVTVGVLTLALTYMILINLGNADIINENLDQNNRWILGTVEHLHNTNMSLHRTLDAKNSTIQYFMGTFTPTETPTPYPTPTPIETNCE